MRVLLIDPPGRIAGVSVALAYITGVLKKNKHEVASLDLNNQHADVQNIHVLVRKKILDFQPDIVGLSLLSLSYDSAMRIVRRIRKYFKGTIVVGGPQTFIEQEGLLENERAVDIVVLGEGEATIIDIINALENKDSLSDVNGIIYRDSNNQIIKTPPRQPIMDLDSIPYPDYKSLGVKRFFIDGKPAYYILTSRGCPYNCSFCFSPALSGRRWRGRKPEKLIEEIRHAKELYGLEYLSIIDDNFTLDMARVERFCDLLIKEKMNIEWGCMARADRIDANLVKKMKKSGCVMIQIGVESLVPAVFKEIDKGESLEDIKRAVKLLQKHGIRVNSFFIIGLPYDTFGGVMESYRLSKKLGFGVNTWQNLMPMPGTRIWDYVQKNGRVINDYKAQSSVIEVGFETPEFTLEERERAFNIISIKEKAYPFDPNRSYVENFLNIFKLILRYDIFRLPSHLFKISTKGFSMLRRGKKSTLSGTEFVSSA